MVGVNLDRYLLIDTNSDIKMGLIVVNSNNSDITVIVIVNIE